MLNKIKDTAAAGANAARTTAKSIGEKIEDVAPDSVKQKLAEAQDLAQDTTVYVKNKAQDTAAEFKEKAGNVAVDKLQEATHKIITKVVAPKLSQSMGKDPDMPQVVRDGITYAVDEIMDEVEIAINEVIEMKIKGTLSDISEKIEADPYPCCCPNPCIWTRALILHTLFPHDKSFWANTRNPVWWLIKITSVFPLYYISTIFWIIVWCLKSKKDEYQLVNFIVELKKAHFISYGVLGSILGNIAFLQCAMIHPHQHPNHYIPQGGGGANYTTPELPCSSNGPGLNLPFWPTAFIFSAQIILTWGSAAFLPCSKRLGDRGNEARSLARAEKLKQKFLKQGKNNEAAEIEKRQKRQNAPRLKYWLIYDSICCIIIIILCVWAAQESIPTVNLNEKIPSLLHQTLWWCRVLYGWLCAPWMLLQGFLYPLVLHTKSTAYNAKGQVTPLANGAEREKAWKKRHSQRSNRIGQAP